MYSLWPSGAIWPIVALQRYMVTYIWIKIVSGDGLLPDGIKPLPESMLTYDQWGSVACTQEQFHGKYLRIQCVRWILKLHW